MNRAHLRETELPWREREFLTMQFAAEIVGVSPASLYVFAKRGDLALEKFAGRTVVRPRELISLLDRSITAWSPGTRGRRSVNPQELAVA